MVKSILHITTVLALSLIALGIKGQSLTVKNAEGKPLANTLVQVLNGDAKNSKVLFTDDNGVLKFDTNGTYVLHINSFGYQTFANIFKIDGNVEVKLELLNQKLDEVVITGQLTETTADKSVNKIKVIDRERIDRQAAVNLRDVLTNEMNIRISQDNVLGSSLSLQGVSGQNIKILIDGVPVIGRLDGNIDISQINLNNIERIEIIEGPMSVIYGTDALGGVINLISKKNINGNIEINANSYMESVGTYNADGNIGFKKNGKSLSISGGRNFFDGFDLNEPSRRKTWKPREQIFGNIAFGFPFKKTTNRLQTSFFSEKMIDKGTENISPYSAYAFDNKYFTDRINASLNTDLKLKKFVSVQFINAFEYFNRDRNKFRKNLVNLEETITPNPEDNDTTTFYLALLRATVNTFNPDKKINHQFGYDINVETAKGQRLLNNYQQMGDYAIFYSMEYKPIEKLVIRPGFRASYNTRYGSPIIPSLNFKYDFAPQWSARASYSRGFRAPSLKELNLFFVDINHNIQGNNDLKAENSDNFNVGLNYKKLMGSTLLKFDVSAFHNAIYDMIDLAVVDIESQFYSYINVGKFKSQGINFTAELKKERYNISLGFGTIGRYNNLVENMGGVNNFSYANEIRFNNQYTIPVIETDLSVFYKYNGAVPGYSIDESGKVTQTQVQAYSMMDVTVSKKFWKNKVQFTTGVKNLLNVNNINFSGQGTGGAHSGGGSSMPIGMGRFVFFGCKINLSYTQK